MPKQESFTNEIKKKKTIVIESIDLLKSINKNLEMLTTQQKNNTIKDRNPAAVKITNSSVTKELSTIRNQVLELQIKYAQLSGDFNQLEEGLLKNIYSQQKTISLTESPSGVFLYARDHIHGEFNKSLF